MYEDRVNQEKLDQAQKAAGLKSKVKGLKGKGGAKKKK